MPDPKDFPKPTPWATWTAGRAQKFMMHATLANAKNAAKSATTYTGRKISPGFNGYWENPMSHDFYIYAWKDGQWVQEFVVKKRSYRSEHPLWKRQTRIAKKYAEAASDEDVDAALASIMEVVQNEVDHD